MHPVDDDRMAFYSLATRYLVGEATCRERECLVELLRQPQWQTLFAQMQTAWNCDNSAGNPFNLSAAKARVQQRIRQQETQTHGATALSTPFAAHDAPQRTHRPTATPSRWFISNVAIAATIALLITLGLTTRHFLRTATTTATPAVATAQTWVEQRNGIGERMDLLLPDGSRIVLNSGSSLQYPQNFNDTHRIVRLDGEAYFDVVSNPKAPFIVETSTLRVRVLGTRFNVKAFNNDEQARVTLIQGKVEIIPYDTPATAQEPAVTLSAGMEYSASASATQPVVAQVDAQAATHWMSDRISWNNEPLPDAMRHLERRYGIPIDIRTPSLRTETITASFDREPIQTIFQLLRSTGGINYEIVGTADAIEKVILFK